MLGLHNLVIRSISQKQILLILRQLYHDKKANIYKKCYTLLGVNEDTTQDTIREKYIELVKKTHPDSGHPDATADRFLEIDSAFRILQEKFAKERREIFDESISEEMKIFDIKHVAPQHRQFLNYDGMGHGSPHHREKQYQQWRATKAQERVFDYRVEKAKASEGALLDKKASAISKQNHAIKTKYGFDRIVEDLIQEAMSKGDFENLEGRGKPLSNAQLQNPYVDFTEHKMNKILLDNGFAPEWITMRKEISTDIDSLNSELFRVRSQYGTNPLAVWERDKWNCFIDQLKSSTVSKINKKIDYYNLIVPILNCQMYRIDLDRMVSVMIRKHHDYFNDENRISQNNNTVTTDPEGNKNIFNIFNYIF